MATSQPTDEQGSQAHQDAIATIAATAAIAPDVISGVAALSQTYSERSEIVSETVFYRGEALPGSLSSATVWRLWKVTVSGLLSVSTWAGGTNLFDKKWDNRTSYTYS